DPAIADTDADGFADHEDDQPLSRAVAIWGYPDFTDGDTYSYIGPQWWAGAGKDGGEWISTESSWMVAAGTAGSLFLDVDRILLSEDIVLELGHLDVPGCNVSLSLLDTNGVTLLEGVSISPTGETGAYRLDRYAVPLSTYPTASRIQLSAQAETETYKVYITVLYIDADGDGLDADQEQQMGTSDQTADSDDDGLSDFQEVLALGSDPMKVDTDGDGLKDSDELQQGTSPSDTDTDLDGLSDGAEVALGLDPAVGGMDSDGDGLSDEVENILRYQVVNSIMTWPDAKAFAELCGGHLLVVSSEEELKAVKTICGKTFGGKPWIGAFKEEDSWKWVNGEAFAYTRWAPKGPNSDPTRTVARIFKSSLHWNNETVEFQSPALIEYDEGLDPFNPDTDGDGLSDGDEYRIHGSNARYGDTDNDGIGDAEEVRLGLNPCLDDTDDDGLKDLDELQLGTDASDADTDQDGLSDGDEVALGLNPLEAGVDSDGDGLSDGLENILRYQVVKTKMSWPDAKAFAELCGGHLLVVSGEEEADAVRTICGDALKASPWIGAFQEEGEWKWVNGEAMNYTRWALNNPNTNSAAKIFVRVLRKSLRWNNRGFYDSSPVLIEFSEGLDPFNPDTDGDGLSDGDEYKIHGTNAQCSDTDKDGLDDAEEIRVGTDPCLNDSDRDGLSDSDELAAGTDPLNPDTDGDGLKDGLEVAQRYQILDEMLTWPEAKQRAEELGGYLATITSKKELYSILKQIPHFRRFIPWLGAEKSEDGVWQWVTGEAFDYTSWSANEPNNYGGVQKYLRIHYGGWDDQSPDWKTIPLIEFDEGLNPLDPDHDDDGLSDGDEVLVYWSDPRRADSDGDGIADGDEVAAGLNPTQADSDGDGIDDNIEPGLGLDPCTADTDGDGLDDWVERAITGTDPLAVDSDSNGVADLTVVQSIKGSDFYSFYDSHMSATWSTAGTAAIVGAVYKNPEVTYQLTVETPGIHQLTVFADAEKGEIFGGEIELHIEIDGCAAGQAKRCEVDSSVRYTLFTPWLTEGMHSVKITLVNERYISGIPFTVHSLEFGMVDGVDSDGDGFADWMGTLLLSGTDTDGDGITDFDEIGIHGTSPTDADTDGDGLDDGDELSARTDPLDSDSDDDGV
ncbi:lectin-like protein, partial [Pontiellaceae bacterium B1224]|nr:lectin-like protein [Pontiellaceae bacterium B1224]